MIWTESTDQGNGYARGWLQMVRMLPDGTVLDTVPKYTMTWSEPQAVYGDNVASMSLASDGTNCLVAYTTSASALYILVNEQGRQLSNEQMIGFTLRRSRLGSVWMGSNYFVAGCDDAYNVRMRRIDAAGQVLDSASILICDDGSVQQEAVIASNGNSGVVAWVDFRGGSTGHIYGTAVLPDGLVKTPNGIDLGVDTGVGFSTYTCAYPSMVYGDGRYLLVWGGNVKKGLFLDDEGKPDGDAFTICTISEDACIDNCLSYADGVFLLVWRKQVSGAPQNHVYATRITSTGVVLDPAGIPLSTTSINGAAGYPAVASGNAFLTAWQSEQSDLLAVKGTQVKTDGSISTPEGETLILQEPVVQQGPIVLSNGLDFFTTWVDNRLDTRSTIFDPLFGSRIQGDGTVLDPAALTLQADAGVSLYKKDRTIEGCVAGSVYVLAWNTYHLIEKIKALSIDMDGNPLGGGAFEVGTAASTESLTFCSLAYNGDKLLAVWERVSTPTQICGSLFAADGTVFRNSFLIAQDDNLNYHHPSVASIGTQFMVAFSKQQNDGSASEKGGAFAVRIDTNGVVLDAAPISLWQASSGYYSGSPKISAAGSNYLVAHTSNGIHLTRISPEGVILTSPKTEVVFEPGTLGYTSVTWNNDVFSFWWLDSIGNNQVVLHRQHVTSDLATMGTVQSIVTYPRIASSGATYTPDISVCPNSEGDYLAAWKDDRVEGGQYLFGKIIPGNVPGDIDVSKRAITLTEATPSEEITVYNQGDLELNWNVETDSTEITVTPQNGTNDGLITVSAANFLTTQIFHVSVANVTSPSDTETIDVTLRETVSPSVTLSSLVSNVTRETPIRVNVIFSETVIGFDASDLFVHNGTLDHFEGAEANYTFDLYPVEQGDVDVAILAGVCNDLSGNPNLASSLFSRSYDLSPPNAPYVVGENPVHHPKPTWRWTSMGGGNGVFRYQVDIEEGAWTETTAVIFTPAQPLAKGAHVLYVQERDVAGNWSASGSAQSIIELTPPSVVLSTTVTSPTNASSFRVKATFSEAITGFEMADIEIVNGNKSNFEVIDSCQYTLTVSPVTQGEVTIRIPAECAFGVGENGNQESPSLTIQYDNEDPAISLNFLKTPDTTPELSGTVTDNQKVASIHVTVNEITYTAQIVDSTWTVQISDALLDGIYDVMAEVTDAAGNTGHDTTNSELIIDTHICHDADIDENWIITAIEISRVVGFFNAGSYHADSSTNDGFAPGNGFIEGMKHDSDYNPPNWIIDAQELGRLVTFYNAGGYHIDSNTQDGFAPDL